MTSLIRFFLLPTANWMRKISLFIPTMTYMMPEVSPRPFTVRVHPFTSPTPHSCAYEYGTRHSDNALIYIGGLTGGPQTTDLVRNVNQDLEMMTERDAVKYSVFEFRMRSSYTGFGYSSLKNDVEDLAALVAYLKGAGVWKKIVLMGSSTGMPSSRPYPFLLSPSSFSLNGLLVYDADLLEKVARLS